MLAFCNNPPRGAAGSPDLSGSSSRWEEEKSTPWSEQVSVKRILSISLVLCILSAASLVAAKTSVSLVGQEAPEIKARDWARTDGKPTTLKQHRGQFVVLDFWSTWDGAYPDIQPDLGRQEKRFERNSVVFISLTPHRWEEVKGLANRSGRKGPLGLESTSAKDYGVVTYPQAFIIDPDGVVVWEGHPMGGLGTALQQAMRARESSAAP